MPAHKLCLLLIVLYTSTLIGCTPSLFVNDATTPIPTTVPLIQPSSTAAGTITVSLPTVPATLIPLPTATPPLPTHLALMCEKTELESVEGYVPGLSGILAYVVPADTGWQRGDGQSGIVGGRPLKSRPFPPVSNIETIGFSPDGNWFAYNKSLEQPGRLEPFVYLLSDQGQTIMTPMPPKSEDETLFWFMTWISNGLMMIQYNRIPSSHGTTYLVDSYTIIDAFTGEEHNELLENLAHWDRWTTPYFSPDMNRAVYITDSRSPLGTSLVLWDTEHQSILWYRPFRSVLGVEEDYLGDRGFDQTVFWAPDGSGFVLTTGEPVSENEISYSSYLVDRDGITERLLVSSPSFTDVMVLGGLWSPDGRFIYYFHGNSFVYDLALNQVIDLCANYSTYVAWSPDSTYLAYIGRVNQEPHLLLFNIYTGEVSSVGMIEDVFGLRWVANEDWLTIP